MRIVLGFVIAGFVVGSTPAAHAAEWCGFLDQEHSRVRCGYSSLDECKTSLGDKKDAVCMPSPSFATRLVRARNG